MHCSRRESSLNLLATLTAVAIATTGCASSATNLQPTDQAITVDGNDADWQGTPLHYLEDSIRVVGVAHDDQRLYVMWRHGDRRLAQLISHRAVVVWINSEGKKKAGFGLRYAGSEEIAQALRQESGSQSSDDQQRRGSRGAPGGSGAMNPSREPGVIEVLDGDRVELWGELEEGGPQAASRSSDGLYCYELSVPLEQISREAFAQMQQLQIGFEIGGMTESERQAMKEKMEGRSGDGGRGGMGGGGRGGMGGGGRGGMGGGGRGGTGGRPPGPMDAGEIEWIEVVLEQGANG